MKWLSGFRVLAMLRRIAKALERANELEEARQQNEWPSHRSIKKFEISRPTVEQWNEKRGDYGQ